MIGKRNTIALLSLILFWIVAIAVNYSQKVTGQLLWGSLQVIFVDLDNNYIYTGNGKQIGKVNVDSIQLSNSRFGPVVLILVPTRPTLKANSLLRCIKYYGSMGVNEFIISDHYKSTFTRTTLLDNWHSPQKCSVMIHDGLFILTINNDTIIQHSSVPNVIPEIRNFRCSVVVSPEAEWEYVANVLDVLYISSGSDISLDVTLQ